MWNSLRIKLLVVLGFTYAVSAVAVLSISLGATRAIIRNEMEDAFERQLDVILSHLQKRHEKLAASGMHGLYAEGYKDSTAREIGAQYYRSGHETRPFIVDRQGVVVLHPDLEAGATDLASKDFAQRMTTSDRGTQEYTWRGEPRWMAYKTFKPWQWTICYTVTTAEKYASVSDVMQILAAIMIAASLLGLVIMYFMLGRVVAPIERLMQDARQIGEGQYDHAIEEVPGKDEIAVLATSFAKMAEQIRDRELKLKISEERYRTLVENIDLGITLISKDYEILMTNAAQGRMFSKPTCEFVGKNCFREFEKRDGVCPHCPGRRAMETGEPAESETEGTRDDGSKVTVNIHAFPVMDANGQATGFIEVIEDITERRQSREALRESEERYRNVYETAPLAFVIWNRQCRITGWNDQAEKIFGWSREEVLGRDLFDLLVPVSSRSRFSVVVEKLLRGEVEPDVVTENLTRDGHTILCRWNNSVLYDREHQPVGALSLALDITEHRKAEQAARAAQERLLTQQRSETERIQAELDKARAALVNQTRLATIGQLAASIAHELRNPLGAVRNASYFLRRYADIPNQECKEHLRIIEAEIGTADRIITELMDMTRSRPPVREHMDLGAAVNQIQSKLETGAIQFTTDLDPDPFMVNADPGQLRQVLTNLLVNAIQAVDRSNGRVEFQASRNGDTDEIRIRDNGPGVPPDQRERVFDALFTTKAKGTGMGLTICREIIERHNGTLGLVETEGPGATFSICLPHNATPLITDSEGRTQAGSVEPAERTSEGDGTGT